jgi:predicted nucleic acid-binding protein
MGELFDRLLPRNSRLRIAKRLLERRLHARPGSGYPDWATIVGRDAEVWQQALDRRKSGSKVLIATSVGSHLPGTSLEGVIAAALTLRGADAEVLLCDRVLPACLAADATWYSDLGRFAAHGPQADLCAQCFSPAQAMYGDLGLTIRRYSELLSPEDEARARAAALGATEASVAGLRLDGMAVGEHALAGALRFYARADLATEPTGGEVLRRYVEAAALAALAARALFRARRYECVVLHHGIYVPQGLIAEAAKAEGVRVVTWNPAYRKHCFIFSHGGTYHHTLLDEPVTAWAGLRLSEAAERRLMDYLRSRATGAGDWIWFHDRPDFDRERLYAQHGLRRELPVIGLLTNVMWDAQLHYPANVFAGMLEWLVETIRYFEKRPDLQLLIRIHPAEIRGTLVSRQRVDAELARIFGRLPANVAVIPPESETSTYVAMAACDAAIVYGTKMGVELTSAGIPVIVAGEAWVRNKGITIDPPTRQAYFETLDRLPLGRRMVEAEIARARRYAFHFFFRRMIPLEFMAPAAGWPPYRPDVERIGTLAPGRSPGLDLICSGILTGTDFVYAAETAATPAPA